MYILGINQGHDASAALIGNTSIIAAAQEERFNRKKHFYGFPVESIKFVLRQAKLKPSDIEYVACANHQDTILLEKKYKAKNGKRKIEYIRLPILTKESQPHPDILHNLSKLGISHYKKLLNIDHHQAHATTAYRCSGWKEATVITLDGNGDNLSGSIYHGRNGKLDKISEITTQGSLGWFYSAVTEALGFRPNDEEGKTMGLAAYGKTNLKIIRELQKFAPKLRGLVLQRDIPWQVVAKPIDGFYRCHFEDSHKIKRLVEKYGKKDVAACAQNIIEEIAQKLVKNAIKKTGCRNLAVAGGIFFNVKLNMMLERLSCVNEIRPHPASGDSGLALGAALEVANLLTPEEKLFNLDNIYLGPSFSNKEIITVLKNKNLKFSSISYRQIPSIVSNYLQKGLAVGWFQGRMEYGPRALGARSVLLDPRNVKAMKRLNNKLKRRKWFMPFAPTVLIEYMEDYIHKPKNLESPFMIKAQRVKKSKLKDIKACTHIDGTIRPQTIARRQNPLYYDVIKQFYEDTGVPAVLNTSFNRHSVPIVCTPQDAIEHLRIGCVDVLVINNIIIGNN